MRTAIRPKHQSLILKCYPALPKATEAKPNPSELSYLLYYASTRRSKLQKVGLFLEKRTASDVWRGRIGNVYVTLEICRALIDKCPRDLNLFATNILTVLQTILKSKDINLIEESLNCFESFCAHHDGANLSSDPDFVRQFEETIKLYAGFAKSPEPRQQLKWRSLGLQAIKSVASSEALSSATDGRRQLSIIIPVILQNVYSEYEDHLLILQQRANNVESEDADGMSRPRLSLATVPSNTTAAAAAAETAEAADRLEEEDIGVLALQSMKRIFEVNNTAQIRYATSVVVDFVTTKPDVSEGWATALLEMVAKWAPVQYRHLILITCQEALVSMPMTEADLPKQLTVAHIISWLLASSVNLIGLSVMDVLLSFINHIIRLLQLESTGSTNYSFLGSHANLSEIGSAAPVTSPGADISHTEPVERVTTPSDIRKELLEELRHCVGNLATHTYYSDQVADMITEILMRLKPSSATSAAASLDPAIAGTAVGNLSEKQNVDEFFSFSTARLMGLKCVMEILTVANGRGGAQSSVGRNAVPLSVWDGTTWLLKEDDRGVRKGYVDALVTYLKSEVCRIAVGGHPISPQRVSSPFDRGSTTFLKLLHVSIYESALQYSLNIDDMIAIHLLLTTLVQTLGTHAVVSGIPMVYKLQSDTATLQDRKSQVALASLIAGYLITIGDTFGLDDVKEGVGMEITHRKEHGQWLPGISYPPEDLPPSPAYPQDKAGYYSDEPIIPFDNKYPIVNDLCAAVANETPNADGPISKLKDALLADWSRESVMAELETRSSRQTSVTESRMAGNGTRGAYLGVAGTTNGRPGSTAGSHKHHHSRPTSKHGGIGNSPGLEKFRVRSQTIDGSTPQSSSSRSSTVRVDELKKVLTGQSSHPQGHYNVYREDSSSGSECHSYTSSDGEELIVANRGRTTLMSVTGDGGAGNMDGSGSHKRRTGSLGSRRGTVGSEAAPPFTGGPRGSSGRVDQVPPMPRMPTMLHFPGSFPGDNEVPVVLNSENGNNNIPDTTVSPVSPVSPASISEELYNRPGSSDIGTEMGSNKFPLSEHSHHHHHHEGSLGTRRVDVQGLLSGLDGSMKKRPASRGVSAGMFRPPY